jgi:TRAP transporter TAXI family solute receptor
MASVALVAGVIFSPSSHAQRVSNLEGAWSKEPVLAAACQSCPWGALGMVIKQQLASYEYNVEMCYNCNLGNGPRIVANRELAPALNQRNADLGVTTRPDRPADFGITSVGILLGAYRGEGAYAGNATTNLRLIARILTPSFLAVATKCELGIKDLAELKGRSKLKVMGSSGGTNALFLNYYGLDEASVKAQGGEFFVQGDIVKREDFDLIVSTATLSNHPEGNVWYEMTQRHNLCFHQLPEELLNRYVSEEGFRRTTIPHRYMRGVDRPIATVSPDRTAGNAVFGRADMPDSFAYDIAKAMYEQRDLFQFGVQPLYYDSRIVWQMPDVPLHPGAAKFYREVGFIK